MAVVKGRFLQPTTASGHKYMCRNSRSRRDAIGRQKRGRKNPIDLLVFQHLNGVIPSHSSVRCSASNKNYFGLSWLGHETGCGSNRSDRPIADSIDGKGRDFSGGDGCKHGEWQLDFHIMAVFLNRGFWVGFWKPLFGTYVKPVVDGEIVDLRGIIYCRTFFLCCLPYFPTPTKSFPNLRRILP